MKLLKNFDSFINESNNAPRDYRSLLVKLVLAGEKLREPKQIGDHASTAAEAPPLVLQDGADLFLLTTRYMGWDNFSRGIYADDDTPGINIVKIENGKARVFDQFNEKLPKHVEAAADADHAGENSTSISTYTTGKNKGEYQYLAILAWGQGGAYALTETCKAAGVDVSMLPPDWKGRSLVNPFTRSIITNQELKNWSKTLYGEQ